MNNFDTINQLWEKLDRKMSNVAIKSRGKIPYTVLNDGTHDNAFERDPAWWTNGFWSGLMWLMYVGTGNEEYKITAEVSEEMMDKVFENFDLFHHDVGFMWHIMSGVDYKITGNRKSRNRNLFAAALLASRYNIDGRYIRAWNGTGNEGWSIIDCMMNIPLLYWASAETGDERFKKIAMAHADMAMNDHVRSDGSVNHIVEHDVNTGAVEKVYGGQGYNDTSCWTRGLAWAVYGFVLSYTYTRKKEYLYTAKKTANYFIANCAKNGYKTVVDFKAPKEPEYFDSTAGVITACGLLEIAKYVCEAERETYIEAAVNILKATDEFFCDYSEDTDMVTKLGTERYPLQNEYGLHIPIIYGDFFYAEALLKLKNPNFLIW